MGIVKFTMHIQGIFKLMLLLLMGHLWFPRCRYCIDSMFLCEAIRAHIGACENHWALIEAPLNVTLI